MTSNCFDPIQPLLDGIAQECALLAYEVARLGALVSSRAGAHGEIVPIAELQAFDVLSQSCQALSQLMSHLTAAPPQAELAHAVMLLEAIPLPAMRGRLRYNLGLPTLPDEETDTIFWIDAPAIAGVRVS